jgi:flavin-dependent dehydrogenase
MRYSCSHGELQLQYDAIIIGAGPAGASTALLLARAGWSVAIIEKKAFPRAKVCGEFISATSHSVLETFGLADIFQQQGGPEVRSVGLLAADTQIISAMPEIKNSSRPYGRALGRMVLDTELLQAAKLAGASVWQPCEVQALNKIAHLYTISLSTGNSFTTPIVIMANGSWEKPLETRFVTKKFSTDFLAFKASFTNGNLALDYMPMLAFPGGYGGLINTSNDEISLSCCIRRDALEKVRKQFTGQSAGEAVLQHILQHVRGVRTILSGAILKNKWLSSGPIKPGLRTCYQNGIFYVGNIAGEAHPVIAEGISMALQSGWLLASNLLMANPSESALIGERYQQSWNKHFKKRITVAAIFANLAIRPWVAPLALPLIKSCPSILSLGAKWSGKTLLLHQN